MADIPEYMTYSYLRNLRQNNAAWRLLTADQAAFIAAFFYREFIAGKRRGIEAQELLELPPQVYFQNFRKNFQE